MRRRAIIKGHEERRQWVFSLYSGNGYMDTHVKNSQIMHFQYVGIISRNLIKQCKVRDVILCLRKRKV